MGKQQRPRPAEACSASPDTKKARCSILDPKPARMILCNYCDTTKAYAQFNIEMQQAWLSREKMRLWASDVAILLGISAMMIRRSLVPSGSAFAIATIAHMSRPKHVLACPPKPNCTSSTQVASSVEHSHRRLGPLMNCNCNLLFARPPRKTVIPSLRAPSRFVVKEIP